MSAGAAERVRLAKLKEPELDRLQPLAAAQARRMAPVNARRREVHMARLGRIAEALVWLLHQANVGTPKPIRHPQPDPFATPQRFQHPARNAAPDWRVTLPKPDLWRLKPAPAKPTPTPTLYGTRYRSAR